MSSPKLLICDLDNTLYDWVSYYAHSFSAFVNELVIATEIDREVLLDDFRDVHRHHQNSEHPFAVLELPSIQRRFAGDSRESVLEALDSSMHAFNSSRVRTLSLYEGVTETLEALKEMGVTVVGHTEAIAEVAYDRLQRLEIVDLFSRLYALEAKLPPHPHNGPRNVPPKGFLERIPTTERKPNPRLLEDICARHGAAPSEAIYVGDSLTKDVSMAASAGAFAVWAKYGTIYDSGLWEILVRVTHWSNEDVLREKMLKIESEGVVPDLTIDSFPELLALFSTREESSIFH